MAAAAADMLVPTLQVTLPTRLFMNVANCVGIYHVAFSVLLCQGVLRRERDNIQIWASKYDLKSSARMKALISHAKTFQMLVARGEFALRLPTDDGPVCCAMKLETNMTIDGLQGIASASTGIAKNKQIITHLGAELVSGLLTENGVGPGSCVIVSEIIEC